MQILLPTSVLGVILLNVFVTSVVLGLAGELSIPFFRRKSLNLQHQMCCVSLILTVVSPLSSGLATAFGLGLVSVPFDRPDFDPVVASHRSELSTPATRTEGAIPSFVSQRDESPFTDSNPGLARSQPTPLRLMDSCRTFLIGLLPAEISTWIVMIWGTGFVLVLFRFAAGLLVVGRLRQTLRKATNPRLLRVARGTLTGALEGTHVYQSRVALTPLTIGWWRCAIVVPEGIIDSLDDQQLASVIAHEAAHVSRRDTAFSLFQQLVTACYWWNPFVRVTNHRIDLLREQICDDYVVTKFGEGRSLASAIVKVVEWSSTRSTPLPMMAQLLSDYDVIETRIRRLLRRDRDSANRINFSAAVRMGGFAFFMLIVPLIPLVKTQICRAAPDEAAADKPVGWDLQIRVVDSEGEPIANPRVGTRLVSQIEAPEWRAGNEQGVCTIRIPDRLPAYCYLYVRADGYAPMRAFWKNSPDRAPDELPTEFTFNMSKSTPVGGLVIDEDGRPVKGATVRFSATDRDSDSAERAESTISQEKILTDANGAWLCGNAPQTIVSASLQVTHPDFALDSHQYSLDDQVEDLYQRKLIWKLKKGLRVQGRVADAQGRPVEGVSLVLCQLNTLTTLPIQKTDAEGRFQFPALPRPDASFANDPIALTITAYKRGFMPVMERVPGFGQRPLGTSKENERSVEITLKKGATLSFRVLDSQKKPVANAWVNPMSWRVTPALESLREFGIPDRTDENGIWTWNDAPPGETIQFAIESPGFARIQQHPVTVKQGGRMETIVMKRPQVLVGRVIDAETKKAVPDFLVKRAFENVAGFPDGLFWTADEIRGKDGDYQGTISMPPHNGRYTYKVVATGYEPTVSKSTPFQEGEVRLDFELKKSQAKKAIPR